MLLIITLATSLGGIVSTLLSAMIPLSWLSRFIDRMISFSTGLLLGTALLHLLPEASEHFEKQGLNQHQFFAWILGSILGFFLLEKIALLRHDHHHEHDGHNHPHGFDQDMAGHGGVTLILGESLHNLMDGIIIAGAFAVNTNLGWVTALSILVHSVPQLIGSFMVLFNAGFTRSKALIYTLASGLGCVVGGFLGFGLLSGHDSWLSYALVVAAASFIYIAVADLIPQLQRKADWKNTLIQCGLIALGVTLAWLSALNQ
jgi:zinc and cadmium transporter